MSGPLKIDRNPGRTRVVLNRPEVRNAIDQALVDGLHAVCAELERDPAILVLAGAPGIFAAGADIAQLRDRRGPDALRGINSGLFDRIARLPLPTIAEIDGPAIGGGAELAYACDLRVGTVRARFANPEPRLGIIAAAGACWRLTELVGEGLAKDMLFTGRMLDADEALAAGLLSRLVGPEVELAGYVDDLISEIRRADPVAVRMTKLVLRAPRGAHPVIDDVAQCSLFESPAKQERMTAFLEKSRSNR